MNKTRLDVFLTQQHPHYSRSQIKKLIEGGFVLVDGVRLKPSHLLNGGERVEMIRRAPPVPRAEAEEIPLDILFEDDDLLVVNKPAGMVVHPAPGHFHGTLVNAVMYHMGRIAPHPPLTLRGGVRETPPLGARGGWEGIRPGIVHRLDKGTSGVMVVTKNEFAHRCVADQFKNRSVKKRYDALVFGAFPQKKGTISLSIGRDSVHRKKFSSRAKRSRESVTHFEVVWQGQGVSYLALRPVTGRTHQIRVHLSESRHPIVGDTLYGAKSFLSSIEDEGVREFLGQVDRPLLHARSLEIAHPRSGERMPFAAAIPDDFVAVARLLRPA